MNPQRDEATWISVVASPSAAPVARTSKRGLLSSLTKVSRAEVALSNRQSLREAVARRLDVLGSTLSEQLKSTVVLHPVSHGLTSALFSHRALHALFDFGGALGVLELDGWAVSALLSALTGDAEVGGLPSRLSAIEEAALGWVLLAALAEWRRDDVLGSWAPRLISVSLDGSALGSLFDERARHLAFSLHVDIGSRRCDVRLVLPALWLQHKTESLAAEQQSPPEASKAWTVPVCCLLGGSTLTRLEREALTVGDVVLLGGVSSHANGLSGPGRLSTPTFELAGCFSDAGFSVARLSECPTQESPMSATNEVAVDVEVELTRFRLPLYELGALHPGSILPLHVNASSQVTLRIDDKPVARAELVDIEGEVGARIIALL